MRRIWNAIRVFCLTLFRREIAEQVDLLLSGTPAPAIEAAAPEPPRTRPKEKPPARSEAITLMATLQREARFVDFVQEPLTGYSDAQIGAAVRDVHRDCALVLERLFALRPLVEQAEGSTIEVPPGFDAGRFRLVGRVQGEPPFRGCVAHHGWEATLCQLPAWTGSDVSARVVAPAEVEL